MIKSFKCKHAEKLFNRLPVKKFPATVKKTMLRKLVMVHAAIEVNDLRIPPGNTLKPLSGNRKGEWSIRINDQWRVCFKWQSGNAYDVIIEDYH
jgi:toxin HigB-1